MGIARRGRPRTFDADVVLEKAMKAFWRKGFANTSVADLTEATGLNPPSLYAAFGNKESLWRKALRRYADGPAAYVSKALDEPTSRQVAERMMLGAAEVGTSPANPAGCLWVRSVLSCGASDEALARELAAQRRVAVTGITKRFQRAIREGDLPADADAHALARHLMTVCFGISVQAAAGASRAELGGVVRVALRAWPGST